MDLTLPPVVPGLFSRLSPLRRNALPLRRNAFFVDAGPDMLPLTSTYYVHTLLHRGAHSRYALQQTRSGSVDTVNRVSFSVFTMPLSRPSRGRPTSMGNIETLEVVHQCVFRLTSLSWVALS